MIPSKITSIEHYDEVVARYNLRGSYSNNYMLRGEILELVRGGNLSVVSTGHNVFFIVPKPGCFRLYYYLNDTSELVFFDKGNFVTEILYRGDAFYPGGEVEFFLRCGFFKNLIRDQYAGIYKDLTLARDDDGIYKDRDHDG